MSITNFKDIKGFLRHYISQLPKKGRGEISRMASFLGVSTTLVSQILKGQKTFTSEQGLTLIPYLGLQGVHADYLTFMIQFERAGTHELKKYWREKLDVLKEQSLKIANRVKSDRFFTDQEKSIFYSQTLYSSIRLFTSVGDRGKSLDEICERFELSRLKASEALKFLVETGLCLEKEGRYYLGSQKTHLEKGSPHLFRHQGNWRIKAIAQSESLTDEELMYTATISLSKKDFELLREEMVQFIKKFLDTIHASPAEEIACLNLDFFWIKK